jgi:hypothetical protein
MGMFYYRFWKKTADELVHKYIEEEDEMKKEDNLERKPNLNQSIKKVPYM